MIEEITIKNFKSLKDVGLSLSNLNVLTGLNGSGKSSLIQSLLLLRQSFNKQSGENPGLILQDGELISLGAGKDVLYQYAKQETIEFELETKEHQFHWEFQSTPNNDILPINHKQEDAALTSLSLFTNHFQYLNAEHISPQISYKKSVSQVVNNGNIGTKGEYVVHYLSEFGTSQKIEFSKLQHSAANSTSLIHQADAWISEITPGTKLVTEDIKGVDVVRLAVKFETEDGYTNEFKPINTGFGISYVLPVVVAILKAKKGDILILENPESHLHPRGQSVIGRMIAYAGQAGIQVFVETHSDHIINGIRVAVKEQKLVRNNVRIFYFDRISKNSEQYSEVEIIRIDNNGELSSYPKYFLDEWNEQLMRLI